MANKSNKSSWDVVRSQKDRDSIKNRDVFNDQQLERGSIKKPQTMTSRTIASVLAGIGVFIVVYLLLGLIGVGTAMLSGNFNNAGNANQSATTQVTKKGGSANRILSGNDVSIVQNTIIKHSPSKGYRIITYGGDPLTKWVKSVKDLPIAGNWSIDNAKDYGFSHDGQSGDASVTTVGNLRKGHVKGKSKANGNAQVQTNKNQAKMTVGQYILMPTFYKLMFSLLAGLGTFFWLYALAKRNLVSQNLLRDTTDINQWHNDQHITLPEEIMRRFAPFPDAGAHSYVRANSLISHTALARKGIKNVMVTQRYDKDQYDKDHNLLAYKGEPKINKDGTLVQKSLPILDTKFMDSLFTASDDPKDPLIRKFYDPTNIPFPSHEYNDDVIGDKGYWKKHKIHTVADLINNDWTFPAYETQRPGGAYWVDSTPVNTMVLAITRAGKGQTYIEPLIDMWTREKRPNNMVINDPKGELLKKFYVPGTYRGFQIVQFNLINSMNTDIYNPLVMASMSAQEGDFKKTSTYIENIAKVFFPLKGGDDPVWPNAANNAFKRAAFGLIDYYLEEEKELRRIARINKTDPRVLNSKIDRLWGHVTLYNCYQLFVQLSAKKITNPINVYNSQIKSHEMDHIIENELAQKGIKPDDPNFNTAKQQIAAKKSKEAQKKAVLWGGQQEQDELTLFFNSTAALPESDMRRLVNNANSALTAMAGADKMLASCDLLLG